MLDRKLTTEAAVNRAVGELEVALIKPLMGLVESWALHEAPAEVQAAFVQAMQALWAQAKRRGSPRLKRERVPLAEQLLSSGLAIEIDGGLEIPCVTEWWDTIEKDRVQTRARRAKQRERRRNADVTPTVGVTSAIPENTQVFSDPTVIKSGTAFALLPEEELRLKKKKKKNTEEPPGFTAYWRVYPVHREKPVALEWWTKLHCEDIADQIVAKVELLKRGDSQWLQGYVKHPHRWLRAHGWEDDPVPFPVSRQEADAADFHRRLDNGEITLEEMFSPQPRGRVVVVK